MRKCLLIFLFASILIGNGMPLWAQEVVIRDTLRASKIEDSRIRRIVGVQVVGSDQIRNHVSPMGESDYIKFIQTLPGVSTGADGTSSIYVRGGNLGGNVVTLDGVPVFGTSHLLGFTTALSNDVVDNTEFQVGGFSSDVGNLTASHIRLHSSDGDMHQWHGSGSVSNFMLSAQANGPIIKDRVSAVVAARYSPLGLEFGLVDKMVPEISGLSTLVYDVYGKVNVRLDDRQTLDFTVFRSKDDYRFTQGGSTQDRMGWSNLIGRAQWTRSLGDRLSLKAIGYWSSRASLQAQEKSVVVDQSMGGIIAPDQTVKNYFSVCDSLQSWGVVELFREPSATGAFGKHHRQPDDKQHLDGPCAGKLPGRRTCSGSRRSSLQFASDFRELRKEHWQGRIQPVGPVAHGRLDRPGRDGGPSGAVLSYPGRTAFRMVAGHGCSVGQGLCSGDGRSGVWRPIR